MELSKAVAALALVLAAALAAGYAVAAKEPPQAREELRRVALAEHQKRKEDVARLCAKPLVSKAELEACRAAYRRL